MKIIIFSMNEKVIGYILLGVGILIIIASGINVYQVFTGVAIPIKPFNFPPVALDASSLLGENAPQGVKMEVVSSDLLNQTSNVFAHLFLMGFILNLGYKLGSLGVTLLRPIEVKAKTNEQTH